MALADALADHPQRDTFDLHELLRAIEACQACAVQCNLCADSDLARDAGAMRDCIQKCLDCATICQATASVLSRPSPSGDAWAAQVRACILACQECAVECESHDAVCCTSCAEACRECERALQQLMAAAS